MKLLKDMLKTDEEYEKLSGYSEWLEKNTSRPELEYKYIGFNERNEYTGIFDTSGDAWYKSSRIEHVCDPVIKLAAEEWDKSHRQYMDSIFQLKINDIISHYPILSKTVAESDNDYFVYDSYLSERVSEIVSLYPTLAKTVVDIVIEMAETAAYSGNDCIPYDDSILEYIDSYLCKANKVLTNLIDKHQK